MRASSILPVAAAAGVVGGALWYLRRRDADATARLAAARADAAQARADRAVADAAQAQVRADAAREHADQLATVAPAPPSTDAPANPPAPVPPVARPAAPPPPAAAAGARSTLTRAFDDLFRRHGQGIPVAYLRALAHAESGLNPRDRLGLINVVPIAVADFNRRHPMSLVRPDQMTDPDVNVRVAVDILRTIIASYKANHPGVAALREDWRNPTFVELLTFGWNAGYSELGGVGRVVRWLRRYQPGWPISLDAVADAAHLAGAAAHLSNPRKRAYSRGVAAAYVRERERDRRDHLPIT